MTSPPPRSLRIRPEEVLARLTCGATVLFLDARSQKALNASARQLPRAVRIQPLRLHPEPFWGMHDLIVIYCA